MNRTAVGLATGVVAIALVSFYMRSPGGDRHDAPQTIAKSPPIASTPTKIGDPSVVPMASSAPSVAPTPVVPVATLPRNPTPLHRQFEEATDIKAFVDQLGRRPKGANEKAYVARALIACKKVAELGSVQRALDEFSSMPKNANLADPNTEKRIKWHADRTARCSGFAGDTITHAEIKELELAAAKGGSPLGLARSIFDIDQHGAARDQTIEAMRQVLQSRDPIAIAELSGAVQFLPLVSVDGISRQQMSEAIGPAWTMIACDLGMDCGVGSSIAVAHCTAYNWCEDGPIETFYERRLPEHTYRVAQQLRGFIGTAIVRGDWRSLGFK